MSFMKPSRNHPARAFTLVELLLVLAVLLFLAALFLPGFARAKARSGRMNCRSNLMMVGLAFRTWALDYNDNYPMTVSVTNGGTMELVISGMVFNHFLVMSNELSTPKNLVCPNETGSKRAVANTFQNKVPDALTIPLTNDNQVSYFVGVDADSSRPWMWLAGDRNLAFDGVPAKPGLHAVSTNSAIPPVLMLILLPCFHDP